MATTAVPRRRSWARLSPLPEIDCASGGVGDLILGSSS
ncbi:hypothetical protein BS78_04G266200 [Paspalum vaginatum]|nr:hypothetical protein BS78_04G266200 [Paspalum vaginatum]